MEYDYVETAIAVIIAALMPLISLLIGYLAVKKDDKPLFNNEARKNKVFWPVTIITFVTLIILKTIIVNNMY